MAIKKMEHVGIVVDDLEAAIEFSSSSDLSREARARSRENG
jgi:hypothetical protein